MRIPALVLLGLSLVPAAASAKPGKPGTVCGVKVLPLAVGNVWTYTTVAAPQPAPPEVARIAPIPPKTFTITVKDIDTKGGETVVSLEEKITYELAPSGTKKAALDERIVHSTITCSAKKFDISPDSYFFAGEPGGYQGLTFDKYDRKGTSWALTRGGFGENEWPEDIVAHWQQEATKESGATLSSGKLEIERRITPSNAEQIVTKAGSYKAEKIFIKTTGRITLDNPKSKDLKPAEMPADWVNILWFAPDYGVVQSLNRYAHMYQLVDAQLK